jgi:hypothetical protein
MDKFFCSHRCTSGATLVRGVSVLNSPARPALFYLFRFFRFFRPPVPQ